VSPGAVLPGPGLLRERSWRAPQLLWLRRQNVPLPAQKHARKCVFKSAGAGILSDMIVPYLRAEYGHLAQTGNN